MIEVSPLHEGRSPSHPNAGELVGPSAVGHVGPALGPKRRPAVFGGRTGFGSATAGSQGVPHRSFSQLPHVGSAPSVPGSDWGVFLGPCPSLSGSVVRFEGSVLSWLCVCPSRRPPLLLCGLLMMALFGSSRWDPRLSGWTLGAHSEQVSVDLLKPAHMLPDEPVELAQAPHRACPPQKECCWRPGPGYCVGANCGLSFPARLIGETRN